MNINKQLSKPPLSKCSMDLFTANNVSLDLRYRYEIAKPKHFDGIVDVFTHAFCLSEPMTHYLLIDPEKFKVFTRAVTQHAINDGLSIVALENDKVIACALVEDMAAPSDIPVDFDPDFRYILALLDQLGSSFFKNKVFQKKQIAHLFITAVDERYRHQGLSTQVNFQAMNLAAKKGFQFIYSELTHFFNEQGIFNHLKNENRLIGNCVYNQFKVDGFKPFPHLDGSAHSYLWALQPGARLRYMTPDGQCHEENLA